MTRPTDLYTAEQVGAMTGRSTKAIEKRLERGTLGYVIQTPPGGGRRRRMIPHYELGKAGLLGATVTPQDRQLVVLIKFLSSHVGEPFTTHQLRTQAKFHPPGRGDLASVEGGAGYRVDRPVDEILSRQACEVALSTLRALKLVEKSVEPPPTGAGRPRNVWRWIGS